MHFGDRLKQERNRLELTQAGLAEKCGVTRRAQIKYESAEQWPGGAYLAAALQAGVDVLYVLGGEPSPAAVDADEQRMVSAWRNASPEARQMVQAALNAAADAPRRAAKVQVGGAISATSIGQAVSGTVAQQENRFDVRVGKKRASRRSEP